MVQKRARLRQKKKRRNKTHSKHSHTTADIGDTKPRMSTAEENENARLRSLMTQRRARLRQKQERAEVNDTETRTPVGLRRSMI